MRWVFSLPLNVDNVSAVLTSTGRSFHHRGARTESSREQTMLGWGAGSSILVLRTGYSMWQIAKKLKISYNGVYYSLQRTEQTGSNQIRKRSGRPWCTTKQEDKYIRVSSLRNRCLTSPQLAASLNGTRKTPVSMSTVKRRLWDAGLLGRVAKKRLYLRLANKRKR